MNFLFNMAEISPIENDSMSPHRAKICKMVMITKFEFC